MLPRGGAPAAGAVVPGGLGAVPVPVAAVCPGAPVRPSQPSPGPGGRRAPRPRSDRAGRVLALLSFCFQWRSCVIGAVVTVSSSLVEEDSFDGQQRRRRG